MNDIDKTYPLFPKLNKDGSEQAQELMDKFKGEARKVLYSVVDEMLTNIYCDIIPEIESDSWTNYRNTMMAGFKNYDNRMIQNRFDFKTIRQEIYRDFKDEIIKDLNQDNLEKIKELEEKIKRLQEVIQNRY